MTFGFGLTAMEEGDLASESGFEDLDELRGESDFGDEEDDGFALVEGFGGELEVDVGFAAAGDAVEQFGVVLDGFEVAESGFLGGIEFYSDVLMFFFCNCYFSIFSFLFYAYG